MSARTTSTGGVSKPSSTHIRPVRSRTKTGCLTCRKRRIKCTEEKPVCNNCIKSKRDCEGYNQPVVFKAPFLGWYGHGVQNSLFPLQYHDAVIPPSGNITIRNQFDEVGMVPRPEPSVSPSTGDLGFQFLSQSFTQPTRSQYGVSTAHSGGYLQSFPHPSPAASSSTNTQQDRIAHASSYSYSAVASVQFDPPPAVVSSIPASYSNMLASVPSMNLSQEAIYGFPVNPNYATTVPTIGQLEPDVSQFQYSEFNEQPLNDITIPNHMDMAPIQLTPVYCGPTNNVSSMLEMGAVERVDDNYYDVNSDDEELDKTLAIRSNFTETIDSFYNAGAQPGLILGQIDLYRPERVANPLRNPATAAIFAYFINYVGSAMSLTERVIAYNPEKTLPNQTLPLEESRGIWNYQMPMIALENQTLLHAILAMSGLHIAKRQNGSTTSSFKHYAFALKRLRLAVSDSKKRHDVATIATALLLAFYEVTTADHYKWSSHLAGAKLLANEVDYAGMTREAYRRNWSHAYLPDQKTLDQMSLVTGCKVDYHDKTSARVGTDEYGNLVPLWRLQNVKIKQYTLYQDMFWWFCRQDLYQSLVSGNRLLLNYGRWSEFPVRGPLGGDGSSVGSHDFVLLLLGRVADFSAKDRKRKLRTHKARAAGVPVPVGPPAGGSPAVVGGSPNAPRGVWPSEGGSSSGQSKGVQTGSAAMGQPPPNFGLNPVVAHAMKPRMEQTNRNFPSSPPVPRNMPAPTSAPSSSSPMGMGPNLGGPPPSQSFYGMAPVKQGPMPSFYTRHSHTCPTANTYADAGPISSDSIGSSPIDYSSTIDTSRLAQTLTQASIDAIKEWESIIGAFQELPKHFPPAYQPLEQAWNPQVDPISPFGPPLIYKTPSIALAWALYHTGHIVAQRAHPYMPPAAMASAGAAASKTGFHANLIGRISSGLIDSVVGLARAENIKREGRTSSSVLNDSAPIPDLNPYLVSALCEITMALFIAGVQFIKPDERYWLVHRLHLIHIQTGWESAKVISHGCQNAWVAIGKRGMAPPWIYLVKDGNDFVSRDSITEDRAGLSTQARPISTSRMADTDKEHDKMGNLPGRSSTTNTNSPAAHTFLRASSGAGPGPSQEQVTSNSSVATVDESWKVTFALGLLSMNDDDCEDV